MKSSSVTLVVALLMVSCLCVEALAEKKGGGKGGGGGTDDGASASYDLVQLLGPGGARSYARSVANTAPDGTTYVSGEWRPDSGVPMACLWRINAANEVAEFVDLSQVLDYSSDVNCHGMVAGQAYDGVQYSALVTFADGSFIDFGGHSVAVALTDPDPLNIVRVYGNQLVDVGDDYFYSSARQWNIDVGTSPPSLVATIDLAGLAPENFLVYDCNNFGEILGRAHKLEPGASSYPVVAWWASPDVIAFDLLPDLSPEAIDDAGNVAGYKQIQNPGASEGIVLAADGTLTNLSLASGKVSTPATGVAMVNGTMQVVGRTSYTRLWSGFLWTNGEMYDLNRLAKIGGGHLGSAEDINNTGVICGTGRFSQQSTDGHGYVLFPVAN